MYDKNLAHVGGKKKIKLPFKEIGIVFKMLCEILVTHSKDLQFETQLADRKLSTVLLFSMTRPQNNVRPT